MLDIDKIFTYHPPKNDQTDRYIKLREAAKEFAKVLVDSNSEDNDFAQAETKYTDIVKKLTPKSPQQEECMIQAQLALDYASEGEDEEFIIIKVQLASMMANAAIAINE